MLDYETTPVARPADVLAAVTKANAALAQTEKVRRMAADPPVAQSLELAVQHSRVIAQVTQAGAVVSEARRKGQLDAAAKVVERIGPEKVRELSAELRRMAHLAEAGRARQAEAVAAVTVAVCRGRVRTGVRPRASRGRAVRLRGSRRTTAPTRAGPEPGDPEPAGSGAPVGDTSRVLHTLLAERSA